MTYIVDEIVVKILKIVQKTGFIAILAGGFCFTADDRKEVPNPAIKA